MPVEEMFKEVIQYAINRGFDICGYLNDANCNKWYEGIHQWQNVVDLQIPFTGHMRTIQADTIFFDHDFAKAFFGSRWIEEIRELATVPKDKRLEVLHSIYRNKSN
jgi:hypothetical protein